MNPYDPPPSDEPRSQSTRRSTAHAVTGTLALAFGLTSGYFIYRAKRLKIDYPDLHDPSPEVDGYWPAIAHTINMGFAILAGLVAAICAATLLFLFLARRRESDERPNGNA